MVVLDGMQGGTAATQDVFIEHCGIPTLAAIRPAVRALQELDMHRKVQLIVSGGIRSGADVAKALALGADAVSIGTAALIALGDNHPRWEADYRKLGTTAGCYDDWHEGSDPAGITTQDPELTAAARSRRGRQAARQLPGRADARVPDDRARQRQEPRAQPGAGGPGGADRGSRRHGGRSACRHGLDTGPRLERVAQRLESPKARGTGC